MRESNKYPISLEWRITKGLRLFPDVITRYHILMERKIPRAMQIQGYSYLNNLFLMILIYNGTERPV